MNDKLLVGEQIVSKDYLDLTNKIINDLNIGVVTATISDRVLFAINNGKYAISWHPASCYCTIITRDSDEKIIRLEIKVTQTLLINLHNKYLFFKEDQVEKQIKKTLQAIL